MAETDPAGNDEARDARLTKERDEARQQAAEATRVLASYQRRDAARAYLKGKVEDPDAVADLVAPHLSEVKLEEVPAFLASDQFAPRLAAFKAAGETPPPPSGEEPGEGEGEEPAPATETPGFGSGPSFGQANGSQPPAGEQAKIKVNSPEYQELVDQGREALDAAYKAGRILEPSRGR